MAGHRVVLPVALEARRKADLVAAETEAKTLGDQVSELLASGVDLRSQEVKALMKLEAAALRRAVVADNPREWLRVQNGPGGLG